MTPDRWQQVEALYHAALERDATERDAFLEVACAGDAELRRDVESLLAQSASAEGFLCEPAAVIAAQMVTNPSSTVLTERRIGAYQLYTLLGAGGMGEVYRARDMKLGRDVAIKILPRAFTSDPERLARFEREARVLASLNHPNIGAIYGLEDLDGVRALVLELVDGPTLADLIAGHSSPDALRAKPRDSEVGPKGKSRAPRLEMKDALSIARQMADALETAHEKGVVHRDLKPANIKITPNGVVKVLDFGLAKVVEAGLAGGVGGDDWANVPTVTIGGTREGTILGTAAYMSPEQARGQTVDKRTDIWAFGCVLYEMLTGHAAFARDTITDTLAAIVEREPDWKTLPEATPASIRHLLQRCLEKDRKQRLRDIGDVRIELDDALGGWDSAQQSKAAQATSSAPRAPTDTLLPIALAPAASVTRRRALWFGGAAGVATVASLATWRLWPRDTGIRSLAVLPFVNAAKDEDAEYLCDGITESLIQRISRLPSLRVMARSTVFELKSKTVDSRDAGRRLSVNAILTGTVTRRSERVLISVELVEVATGAQLWGNTYDRAAADILSLQDDIARAVVDEGIGLRLTGDDRRRLAQGPTDNKEAYDLYLRALQYVYRETEQDYLRAREILERVVALDKNFSLAQVALARTYASTAIDGYERPTEAWPKANQSIARALELEPDLPDAHLMLGSKAFFFDWDWLSADREFRMVMRSATRSIDPAPVSSYALQRWALGHLDDALTLVRKARELNQFSPLLITLEADLLLHAQQFEAAAALYQRVTQEEPGDPRAFFGLAEARRAQGRFVEAIDARRRGHTAAGDDSLRDVLAHASGAEGYHQIELATARVQLDELRSRGAAGTYVSPLDFARVYAQLGDKDEAFRTLSAAFEDRAPGLVFLKVDRAWDAVRDDATFLQAVRRVGLP